MESPGDVFCSTTEFKARLRHYKALAKTNFVHITDHGHASHVLVSVEAFETRKAERCRQAKWLVWAENACRYGSRDDEMGCMAPSSRVSVEYLGRPWDDCISSNFDDDIRRLELTDDGLFLVKQCLQRLSVNPQAGRPIEVGPEAGLSEGTQAYRLPAGAHDIIYGIDKSGELRVYGLIEAL